MLFSQHIIVRVWEDIDLYVGFCSSLVSLALLSFLTRAKEKGLAKVTLDYYEESDYVMHGIDCVD